MSNPDDLLELAWLESTVLSDDDPRQVQLQHKISKIHFERFRDEKDQNDIEAAVAAGQKAVQLAPQDCSVLPEICVNLAHILYYQFKATNAFDDLQDTIEGAMKALSMISEDHTEAGLIRYILINSHHERFSRTHNYEDLQVAETLATSTVEGRNRCSLLPAFEREGVTPTSTEMHHTMSDQIFPPEAFSMRPCLATSEEVQSILARNPQALVMEADRAPSPVLEDISQQVPESMTGQHFLSMANIYRAKYRRTRESRYLDRQIAALKKALAATSLDESDRCGVLSDLGAGLDERHSSNGSIEDLQNAVECFRTAVRLQCWDKSTRGMIVQNLAKCLCTLYENTKERHLLNQAMKLAEEGLELAEEGDKEIRVSSLVTLGIVSHYRYEELGHLADLDDSIAKLEEADLLPCPDTTIAVCLLNLLSMDLLNKYELTGDMELLERSIARLREAVERTPDDIPDRGISYANLGIAIEAKYLRTGHEDSLTEAVSLYRRAIAETSPQRVSYGQYLGGLSNGLTEMWILKRDLRYLDEGIACLNDGIRAMGVSSLRAAMLRGSLGGKLYNRHMETGNVDDINSAIENSRACKDSLSLQEPSRTKVLHNLGLSLFIRAEKYGDSIQKDRDLLESRICLREAVESPSGTPVDRINSARAFLDKFNNDQNRESANDVATLALDLLPYACGRHLQREDQEHAVSQIRGFAADACSISILLDRPEDALQRIEYGRGLVLGNLIDRRDDLVEVRRQCPTLADEYESLRYRAFRTIDFSGSKDWERQAQDRRQAFQELLTCEESIRKLHGLEDFLRPASIKRLQRCAKNGPIVIVNVTHIGSGAVIVTDSRLEIVHLQNMDSNAPKFLQEALGNYRATAASVDGIGRDMKPIPRASPSRQMLTWLWRCCVHPVLNRLSGMGLISTTGESRVWWIGSGVASSLPFHAAGEFNPDHLHERNLDRPSSCLDWIVPSYTPTIKALEHSRAHANALKLPDKLSILAVSMLQTPGQVDLPGVGKEVEAVKAIIGQNCHMSSLTLLEQPTAQEVSDGILRSHIVHFACHGSSDAVNPSESHIVLQKLDTQGRAVEDKLTVAALLDSIARERGWIVYLSACSTAQIKAKKFADEGIHLASAFQVAGFANAIGSLWAADDQTCVDVARHFYKALLEGIGQLQTVQPAIALRSAIMNVRFKGRELQPPEFWAPFIHYGA